MRDLSNDRNGIRIEIELKKEAQPEVVLNQLYKLSPLESSFGINNNVLVDNKPMLLSLKEIIQCYVDHQISVVRRRTQYDLNEDEKLFNLLKQMIIICYQFINENFSKKCKINIRNLTYFKDLY
mgnify:CR=1 FL=1